MNVYAHAVKLTSTPQLFDFLTGRLVDFPTFQLFNFLTSHPPEWGAKPKILIFLQVEELH